MKVGIIGSGSMGTGIAQVAATNGHEVLIFDQQPDALIRARDFLSNILNRLASKGRITDDESKAIFGRIYFLDSMTGLKDADLVIEAIIENLSVKQSVFKELESIISPDAILATNTSSLSVSAIAAACAKPERVLGIHFFNPAALMKLVEIIPAIQTSPDITQRAKSTISQWGKTTVLAKDTPGFIVNRVARPFYGEALRIIDEGLADAATVDWAMTDLGGFKMGPFTLMDYIGNDVNYTVTETVFKAFYYDPRYRPSFTQKRLAEAGYFGRKSGKGYYEYGEGATNPEPDRNRSKGHVLLRRILVMLINEAADALFWGIASKEDIELAMTKGVNYPKGLLRWADELGIESCVRMMDELYDYYREDRYRCSPLLRKMARSNETFFPTGDKWV